MLIVMIFVFLLGYIAIAVEHKTEINKAVPALLSAGVLWILYMMGAPYLAEQVSPIDFEHFITNNSSLSLLPKIDQWHKFIVNVQIIEHLGEISETLFFLMGAMTIVEIIDVHGGFTIITHRIKTRDKKKLLWLVALISFFMSAALDNMTTAIVMVMLMRRIVPNHIERWIYAGVIIIAANSGGAWSPIGDVTTIMLWVKGNVTSSTLVSLLLLPSLVSLLVPLLLISRKLTGNVLPCDSVDKASTNVEEIITTHERTVIFFLGVGSLLAVPLFKAITHLPPFMGVMGGLAIVWGYTELMYSRKVDVEERLKHRVTRVIKRVDTSTLLFFLGILMAVAALQVTGVLDMMAQSLNDALPNIYAINLIIGILSSIVDNVPLVAAALGMYPVVDPATLSTLADPSFMANFVVDGHFWTFLAYCAGVGGSILIIGSVAGVVVMGIEKISFGWYLRHISFLALLGYFAGAAVYIAEVMWLGL